MPASFPGSSPAISVREDLSYDNILYATKLGRSPCTRLYSLQNFSMQNLTPAAHDGCPHHRTQRMDVVHSIMMSLGFIIILKLFAAT